MARVRPVIFHLDECRQKKLICFSTLTSILLGGFAAYQLYQNIKIYEILIKSKSETDKVANNQVEINWGMKKLQLEVKQFEKKVMDLSYTINEFLAQDMNKQNLIDYAHQSAGASIVSTGNTKSYKSPQGFSLLGFPICTGTSNAEVILQKSSKAGDCWAIEGAEGKAVIRLSSILHIENVSLEHIHKNIAPLRDTSSAPKKFSLWGLESEKSEDNKHLFGIFDYNNNGPAVQTFAVQQAGLRPYRIVEFQVHSNHGNPNYTCIYKIQVHGKEASSVSFATNYL